MPPTSTVATTSWRRGLMREMLLEYLFATHTDPVSVATADGPLPTGIVARTVKALAGRSRRRCRRGCWPPTAPGAERERCGPLPTCAREMVRPVRASSFSTVAVSYPATQIPRPLNATALGRRSRERVRRADPVVGSISVERPSRRVRYPQLAPRRTRPCPGSRRPGNRLRHAFTGPGSIPRHGRPHECAADPDRPAAAHEAPRLGRRPDSIDHGARGGIDTRDGPAIGVGHPHRAGAGSDRARGSGERSRAGPLAGAQGKQAPLAPAARAGGVDAAPEPNMIPIARCTPRRPSQQQRKPATTRSGHANQPGWPRQCRVVLEYPPLELAQLGAWIQAELVGQPTTPSKAARASAWRAAR